MTLEEVCDDPCLQELPYKIELNKWGNIEMSPVRNRHGEFQSRISHLLQLEKPEGIWTTECGVDTTENTKVPGVTWVSFERRPARVCLRGGSGDLRGDPFTYQHARRADAQRPALSGGRRAGVWLCDACGAMRFFDANGELAHSLLCPGFPAQVEIR